MSSIARRWLWIAAALGLAGFVWARSTRGKNVLLDLTGGRMYLSIAGQDVLKQREGFQAQRYPDPPGQSVTYSIGWGHKLKPGELFLDGVDEATANALLAADVHDTEDVVNAGVTVELLQAQFDALVIFVFNTSSREPEKFLQSTLLRKLNAGDTEGATAEFARWNKVHRGGELVADAGLTERRAVEARLFSSGQYA